MLSTASAFGLTVELGSDGSDGPLDITTDTIMPLSADGIYHFTSVNISEGATLSFSYEGDWHPGVVFLATSDVAINGTIDLSGEASEVAIAGRGGPGGTKGGIPTRFTSNQSASLYVVDPTHLLPYGYESGAGIRPVGGGGGIGSHPSGSDCENIGAGGAGGGGAILIFADGVVSGSGAITASGGVADETNSNGGCSSRGGEDGESGTIRIAGKHVNLGDATLTARVIRLDSPSFDSLPSFQKGTSSDGPTVNTGALLQRFPTTLPTALIVAIDGEPVEPNSFYQMPDYSTAQTVTVQVDNCSASEVTAGILEKGEGKTLSSVVENPSDSELLDVNLSINLSTTGNSIKTSAQLYAFAYCGPLTIP